MPSINKPHFSFALVLGLSLAACRSIEQPIPALVAEDVAKPALNHYVPVQRYGRYTLIEMTSLAAQQDLLLQVIDINLPSTWSISVAQALRYALLRSGYQLCERNSENAPLFDLPLPAAHLNLGPIVLRDALQLLAGSAWSLQTNEKLRQVCFTAAPSSKALAPPHISKTHEASQ